MAKAFKYLLKQGVRSFRNHHQRQSPLRFVAVSCCPRFCASVDPILKEAFFLLPTKIKDRSNTPLPPESVNCLRSFPARPFLAVLFMYPFRRYLFWVKGIFLATEEGVDVVKKDIGVWCRGETACFFGIPLSFWIPYSYPSTQ